MSELQNFVDAYSRLNRPVDLLKDLLDFGCLVKFERREEKDRCKYERCYITYYIRSIKADLTLVVGFRRTPIRGGKLECRVKINHIKKRCDIVADPCFWAEYESIEDVDLVRRIKQFLLDRGVEFNG